MHYRYVSFVQGHYMLFTQRQFVDEIIEPNWLKGERTYDPEKDSSQTLRSFIMNLTFDL